MKNQDDKVTVIMPSYNHAAYIEEAINSVINQTYKNWELIITDDGSKDGSLEIIKKYADRLPNIKFHTHPNNTHRGLGSTYSLAISKANGEYLAFLESDDIWEEKSLELKVESFKKHPDLAVLYSDVQLITDGIDANAKKGFVGRCRNLGRRHKQPFMAIKYLLKRNMIPTFSVVMTKRSLLKDVNFSVKEPQIWLDWWIWSQLAVRGGFLFLPEKLTKWRIYKKSSNQQFVENINLGEYFILYKKDLTKLISKDINKIKGIRNKLAVVSASIENYFQSLTVSK